MNGRLAIWSMACDNSARMFATRGKRVPAAGDSSGRDQTGGCDPFGRGDVSSQFLTALLMALPLTGREAVIELTTELISKPYVEITLNLMARFGVRVERQGWQRFVLPAGQRYRSPGVLHVEGDASAASYSLRLAPSVAVRYVSRASGGTASRAMCASPKRSKHGRADRVGP